jgi:hypothetical protein
MNMNQNDPPTLEELLATQKKVMQDITEAEKLFASESAAESAAELRTMRSGLKQLGEKIEELRARNGNR